ncbi:MAG TPA: ABC transporter ATP-binding protein [Blastocatellia bacterium]|nr:ABC transporter ATP-binding protein [Blastocatellia bacterium]
MIRQEQQNRISGSGALLKNLLARRPARGADLKPAGRPDQKKQMMALLRALTYLSAYKRDVIGASIFLILVSTASLVVPQLFRYAIDTGIGQRQKAAIVVAVGVIFLVATARAVFAFLQSYLAERVSQSIGEDLRVSLYSHIHQLSYTFSNTVHSGQILTRMTGDVDQVRAFVGGGVIRLSGAMILFLACFVLLIQLNWKLALITFATLPASFFLLMRIGRKVGPLFGRIQQAVGKLSIIMQEDLAGMRVIRAFCREAFELDRFKSVNREWLRNNNLFLHHYTNNFPFALFFANVATLVIIGYGGWESIAGRLTIGELVAFYSYLSFLHYTTILISFVTTYILGAASASTRVFEILDTPLDVRESPDAFELPAISGQVEFKDVRFRYPGSRAETLKGINFTIEPGQLVALVGPTGSGKSTFINLIPRLHDVSSGAVMIDGSDVREVTLSSLRGQIGVVLQESLLFSGSMRENIAYGKPNALDEEIETAARAAQAHDFITKLPGGYDSLVEAGGANLSGGQRQRIAIARAILIEPRLLILDDSTSAVDSVTEIGIQESLDHLMREDGRTVFVIAHRISTIRDADLILLLSEGRILSQGTHETLLRESPLYYDILGSQVTDFAGDQLSGGPATQTGVTT